MNIKPKESSIDGFFNTPNEQFVVPVYQRRYAWRATQYEAIFDDINKLADDDTHLFGTVIFNVGYYDGNLNKIDVVDGQQRIISLVLLMYAIKDIYRRFSIEYDNLNRYLNCSTIGKQKYNKIILGDLDNNDFERVINNDDIEKVKNRNLFNAYKYYYDCIEKLVGENKHDKFFYKLRFNCMLIRIEINNAKNVYRLFEVINNRGLRLSSTDIIKNFILGHASQISAEALDKVKRLWADIIIVLDGINTDSFLRQYISCIVKRKVTRNQLLKEFKNYYKARVKESEVISDYSIEDEFEDDEDIESNGDENKSQKLNKVSIDNYLKSLKKYAEIYANITNKSFEDDIINKNLRDLERIQSLPANIFLLHLLSAKLTKKEVYKSLNQIKSFMIRRNICEYRTGELDSIFAKLCTIENVNINEWIKKKLSEEFPSDEEFCNSFPKHQFKGKNKERAKYVLEQIEYYLTNNKNEYIINSSDEVHLEHIMPKSMKTKKSKKEFGDWEEYLGEDNASKHKRYVWRIGNLTLLSDELNLDASNNPFTMKKTFYKKSSLRLNNEIVKNYRQFRFNNQEKRGKELANIALQIWKL